MSSSNVTGTISVYDVRIIAERPALKLFLDASGDFNAAAPDDDLPTYVPGNNFSSHQPEDIPEEGNPIHTVYVVAAYVLANGQIAPPPDGVSRALFLLTDVSAYAGMAMNLTGNAGDLVMPDSAVDFLPDHTARSALMVYDYAAWGHVIVTAGSDSQQMWVPKDNDWNGIADVGWNSADGTPVPDAFGSNVWADQDPDPTGDSTDGDGLGAIEEYRGFRVNGHIRRLDTGRKDLFIYSEHPQSIGDAASLPLNLHLLQAGEMDTETRIINPYFENTGYGPSDGTTTGPPLRSESAFQRGLYVIDGLDSGTGAVGATPRAVAGDVVPNDVSGPIEIYTSTIRKASPPHNTLTDVDPLDEPKNNQTLGHEIGHGSHIPHWRVDTLNPDCSDAAVFEQRDPTVMVTCWLRGPDDERWNNLPHVYDPTDLSHLRIKKVQQ